MTKVNKNIRDRTITISEAAKRHLKEEQALIRATEGRHCTFAELVDNIISKAKKYDNAHEKQPNKYGQQRLQTYSK